MEEEQAECWEGKLTIDSICIITCLIERKRRCRRNIFDSPGPERSLPIQTKKQLMELLK